MIIFVDFNTTADDAIADDQLQQMYAKIVTEGEVGNISLVVNATVLGLGVAEPTLDPSDPKWARVTTDDKYRILIQVDHLDFEITTLPQYEGTIFPRQPKICAYDIVVCIIIRQYEGTLTMRYTKKMNIYSCNLQFITLVGDGFFYVFT